MNLLYSQSYRTMLNIMFVEIDIDSYKKYEQMMLYFL